jgi:hypothetical protein
VPRIGQRILGRRGLRFTVIAHERARLAGTATIQVGGARYALQRAFSPLRPRAPFTTVQAYPVQLNLATSLRTRRAVRSALARHRAVQAEVTILAADALGNKRIVTRVVPIVG